MDKEIIDICLKDNTSTRSYEQGWDNAMQILVDGVLNVGYSIDKFIASLAECDTEEEE